MFHTIVVAVDLEPDGDRALPVARSLGELGEVPIELLTVSSPNEPEHVDSFELGRRAIANGWPANSYTIAHSDEVAAAIYQHLQGLDAPLLAMATSAKRPLVGRLLGSVTEGVLALAEHPVLLVGPKVPSTFVWHSPTPVVCVDASDRAAQIVPAVTAWVRTFSSSSIHVLAVVPPTTDPMSRSVESAPVRHVVDRLQQDGVEATWDVVHGGEPEYWLEKYTAHIAEPLFVTSSARWSDGRPHWHSATRQLVRRTTAPVLVVPAHRSR
jgi:nucleotide-binding universal stress UspA family protein